MKNPHKHIVKLSGQEQKQLQDITRSGTHNARLIKRAQILLKSHAGYKDQDIAEHVGVSKRTVERVRKNYTEGGLERALYDAPHPGAAPVLDDRAEAYLVATACTEPPEGRERWTLELLQEHLLKHNIVKHISTVAIWRHLTERGIKPWREKNVVHPNNR